MKKYSLVLLLAFVCSFLHAQTGDTTIVQEKNVTFTAGALYNSSLNYYGRTDSLKSQGWVPFAGITLKNGLYLFSNFIFINNALTTTYAATTVEAGYKFITRKGSLAGNIYGIGN